MSDLQRTRRHAEGCGEERVTAVRSSGRKGGGEESKEDEEKSDYRRRTEK